MAIFLICKDCEKEELVPEKTIDILASEEQSPDEYICQRCIDLYYRPHEEEQMEREAYRAARMAE